MSYLVDANIIIYAVSGRFPILNRALQAVAIGDVLLSTIVLAELALGSENGLAPGAETLDRLIEQIPVVAFDEAAARACARLPFKRARFDRLLAAHALSLGATIVTANDADFADIPGLRVENWTT